MKNIPAVCRKDKTDKIITFKEKKSILYLSNEKGKTVACIKVDGCAIKEGKRCDNLYEHDGEEHFLELKGSNIKDAVEQLKRSIELLSGHRRNKIYAEVVSPRCATIGNDIQRYKKEFNKLNIDFHIYKTKSKRTI